MAAGALAVGAVAVAASLLTWANPLDDPLPRVQVPAQDGYVVADSFPHDPEAFTQGLEFRGSRLFESTGLNGESSLRLVDLESGDVRRRTELAEKYFGEGITFFDDRIYWITWQNSRAFVYRPRDFERLRRYSYTGEGWGLTHNAKRLVMSDGTNEIVFRDPKTFEITRRLAVTDGGEPVHQLNELEWINGEIFANVWQTARIVRIDPSTGEVVDSFDIDALWDAEKAAGEPDVPNGIAYMKSEDRLFVTGKRWRQVYEIELTD